MKCPGSGFRRENLLETVTINPNFIIEMKRTCKPGECVE
jgi:hypothetical protein